MFKSSKIKRILAAFGKTEGAQRKEALLRLATFGTVPIPMVTEALRYNRILYADAELIFHKLYNKENLGAYIDGLAETKENIRELYKETIIQLGKSNAVSSLIERLDDDDHMIRKMVGEIIVELADASVANKIIPFVRHDSKDVKKTAMDVLTSLKAEKAVEAIIPLLDEEDSWIRRKAVEALCKLEDRSVLPRLIEIAHAENNPTLIRPVLHTASKIGDPATAKSILQFVKSQDIVIRQMATESVIKMGDSTIVTEVMLLLKDEDVNVRRCAVDILNGLQDSGTAEALVSAVKDADWWVREIATEALSELGGGKISDMIKKLLTDKDESVRRCAVEFYCKIKDPTAFDALVKLLDDKDWWVREKAITALGFIGDKAGIPHIGKLVNDAEVKWAIPGAMEKIGGAETLGPLSTLLEDNTKHVRMESMRVVGVVGGDQAVDLIKKMAMDKDPDIQNEALKLLKKITGRRWLMEDVLKETQNAPPIEEDEDENTSAQTGDLLTEAILVIDLCRSTDIASSYGDHTVYELMQSLGDIVMRFAKKAGIGFSKSTGDGFMITFADVPKAMNVAVKTLETIIERNAKVTKRKRLDVRIAINVGETRVEKTGDRLGNAVNMTFRVESLKRDQVVTTSKESNPNAMLDNNRLLLTEAAMKEIADDQRYMLLPLGFFELKGIQGLHQIYQLIMRPVT